GPAPEDNYDLVRDVNGKYRIEGMEAGGSDRRVARAMWFTQSDLHGVEQACAALDRRLQSIEQKTAPDASGELQQLSNIRASAREFRDRARQDNLSPDEMARTYH